MRLITWNVNGLRAHINKGAWEWSAKQKADVICYQEIKAKPEQLTASQMESFDDYQQAWNPAEKLGYSGVATFSKEAALNITIGMGKPKFDVEGRVLETDFGDFTLFNVYFPSGQKGPERVKYKLSFYRALLKRIDALHAAGKQVIVCGDYNTAFTEIDLARPKTNKKTSGFLPEEREMLGTYFKHGLVDTYRAFHPEEIKYTWWSLRSGARVTNVGWRLDYFLASEDLMSKIKSVEIRDQVEGSDHCPVELVIN